MSFRPGSVWRRPLSNARCLSRRADTGTITRARVHTNDRDLMRTERQKDSCSPSIGCEGKEMTFEDFLAADKTYQQLKKKSAELARKRGSMSIGSTRARVTTANANWARAAEARDYREEYLRREWEKTEGK